VSPWIVQLIVVAFVVAIVEWLFLGAGASRDTISILQIALFAILGFWIIRLQVRRLRSVKTLDDLLSHMPSPWTPWNEWPEELRRDMKIEWSIMSAIIFLGVVHFILKH
jgi:hypothetical protein